MDVTWGDNECTTQITSVDALAILRNVAVMSALNQREPCPDVGLQVDVTGYSPHEWADLECDGNVSSKDALAVLRNVAMMSPLVQHEPCPDIGDDVHITIAVEQ